MHLLVPRICLLLPEFGQKRPRDALLLASGHPSTSFPFTTSGTVFSAVLCPQGIANIPCVCVCVLRFLLTNQKLLDSLELFHPGRGWRPPSTTYSTCVFRRVTPTSPWVSSSTTMRQLLGAWTISFSNWLRRSLRVPNILEDAKSVQQQQHLLPECKKLSQDELCETMEATMVLENQAFLDLHALASACANPISVTCWKATC